MTALFPSLVPLTGLLCRNPAIPQKPTKRTKSQSLGNDGVLLRPSRSLINDQSQSGWIPTSAHRFLRVLRFLLWTSESLRFRNTRTGLFAVAMSLAGFIQVFGQPVITNQPQNQTNVAGTTAMFTVSATGAEPLSYQWRSHANTTTFTNIPFGTEATLMLTNVQPTGRRFAVVVTDSGGLSATSSPLATLTVLLPPSLTASPSNQIAEVGDTVTFSALAAGTPPLFYQWLFQDGTLPNRTKTNLYLRTVQLTNAGAYKVVVTNVAGSATSQVATLTVVAPAITRTSGTNILLVIADDYGTDSLSLYNTNASASLPPTPNINSLYNSGVLFRNAYACPTCAPTRSCLMTGRYGFRTGIGLTIGVIALQANELTIPEILTTHPQLGYGHASIGK